jgi:hypothetical protein
MIRMTSNISRSTEVKFEIELLDQSPCIGHRGEKEICELITLQNPIAEAIVAAVAYLRAMYAEAASCQRRRS